MPSRRHFLLGCVAAGAALSAPVGWYGGVYEPNAIEVTHRAIAIRNLPARLAGRTAIQISDLHLHRGDSHRQLIDLVKKERADYLFFTGDLVNEAAALGEAEDLFAGIEAPGGRWAVIGNSDRSSGVDQILKDRFGYRLRYLVNDAAEIEAGLWLVGVNDSSNYMSDVPAALAGVPAAAPRILLAHSPDIADQMEGARFDLVLAGHTHGGQVRLPVFDGAWLHEGLSSRYVEGFYAIHGAPLYVNRGIGTSRIPLRIFARPEITHFTFHAA